MLNVNTKLEALRATLLKPLISSIYFIIYKLRKYKVVLMFFSWLCVGVMKNQSLCIF